MKYLLLISMLFASFSPKAVCMSTMSCCEDTETVDIVFLEDTQDADLPACCLHHNESQEKDEHKSHASHDCCCLTVVNTVFIESNSMSTSHESNQEVHKEVAKLTSHLSFSIWIPPSEVA